MSYISEKWGEFKNNLGRFSGGGRKEKYAGIVINVRASSRSNQDLGKWKGALKIAERAVNPNRKLLYEIYEDTILDDDFVSAIQKRRSSLTQLNLQYLSNGKPNKKMEDWMLSPAFRQFKIDIIDTIFWGFSLFEFDYKDDQFYKLVPRKHVEPISGQILPYASDYLGVEYRTKGWDKYLCECGQAGDLGMLLIISIPAIYKRNGRGDWALYCEKTGNTFDILTMEGSSKQLREEALEKINARGSGAAVSLPKGIEVETQKNSSSSSNELFKIFDDTMSHAILRLILGQASTTDDIQGGSYAKSKVALEVEKSILQNDKTYMLEFFNFTFKKYLQGWGMPTNGEFVFEDIDNKSRNEKIEEDKGISEILQQGQLSKDYIAKKYDVELEKTQSEPIKNTPNELPV